MCYIPISPEQTDEADALTTGHIPVTLITIGERKLKVRFITQVRLLSPPDMDMDIFTSQITPHVVMVIEYCLKIC